MKAAGYSQEQTAATPPTPSWKEGDTNDSVVLGVPDVDDNDEVEKYKAILIVLLAQLPKIVPVVLVVKIGKANCASQVGAAMIGVVVEVGGVEVGVDVGVVIGVVVDVVVAEPPPVEDELPDDPPLLWLDDDEPPPPEPTLGVADGVVLMVVATGVLTVGEVIGATTGGVTTTFGLGVMITATGVTTGGGLTTGAGVTGVDLIWLLDCETAGAGDNESLSDSAPEIIRPTTVST